MVRYTKGYKEDAGVDIVLHKTIYIEPGFQTLDLEINYTPAEDEVAFLVSRGSTASKGIFPLAVAIDPGYTGSVTAWVLNATDETHTFYPGDRVFGIVNLKQAPARVDYTIAKDGTRGNNRLGSSGGTQ